MALLQSVGRKILTYVSPSAKKQSAYFKITRDISEAQFYLGGIYDNGHGVAQDYSAAI